MMMRAKILRDLTAERSGSLTEDSEDSTQALRDDEMR